MGHVQIVARFNRDPAHIIRALVFKAAAGGEFALGLQTEGLAEQHIGVDVLAIGRKAQAQIGARPALPLVEPGEFVGAQKIRIVEFEADRVLVRDAVGIAAIGRIDHLHHRLDHLTRGAGPAHERPAPVHRGITEDPGLGVFVLAGDREGLDFIGHRIVGNGGAQFHIAGVIEIAAQMAGRGQHIAPARDERPLPGSRDRHPLGIGAVGVQRVVVLGEDAAHIGRAGPVQGEGIGIEDELAPEPGIVVHLTMVGQDGNDGRRRIVVFGPEAIEEIAVIDRLSLRPQIADIDIVDQTVVLRDIETAQIGIVRGRLKLEAPIGLRGDLKISLAKQMRPNPPVGGFHQALAGHAVILERARAALVVHTVEHPVIVRIARGELHPFFIEEAGIGEGPVEPIIALVRPVTEFRLGHRPLARGEQRRQGDVHVRLKVNEIGHFDKIAEFGGIADRGRQEAGFALHRRIGMREIRQIDHRHAEDFEAGMAVADGLVRLVVDDLAGLQLPARGVAFLADLTRAVDGFFQDRHAVFLAHGAGGGEPGVFVEHEAQALDDAAFEFAGDVDPLGIDRRTVFLNEAHIAGGDQGAGAFLVSDRVGAQDPAVLAGLHIARRGPDPRLGIEGEFVRLQKNRRAQGVLAAAQRAAQGIGAVGRGLGQGRTAQGQRGRAQAERQHQRGAGAARSVRGRPGERHCARVRSVEHDSLSRLPGETEWPAPTGPSPRSAPRRPGPAA